MKIKIVFLFLSISFCCFSQTEEVTGKVTTKYKNKNVSGVTVSIKDKDETTKTDKDGLYSINADKNDILVFSRFGYETKEVKVKKNKIDVLLYVDYTNYYDPDELDELIGSLNHQINKLRDEFEHSICRPPPRCPPCPPEKPVQK